MIENLLYNFQNKILLEQALTRKSASQEKGNLISVDHNNRFEFLGDSILRSVVDDCLMEQFPEYREDQLSIERDLLVSKNGKLFDVAERLKLDHFIRSGKGEKISIQGAGRKKILTDVMEAIIGAVFIDCGRDHSIIKWFIGEHFELNIQHHKDQCLFDAVEKGDLSKIKFWLTNGANPNERKVLKRTVGSSAVVSPLKSEKGRRSNIFFPAVGIVNIKCSSLELAILYSSLNRNTVDIVCTLLKYKADPNSIGYFECSLLQQIITYNLQEFSLKKELEIIDSRNLSEVVNSFIEQNPTYVVSCWAYGKLNPGEEIKIDVDLSKVIYCTLKDQKDPRYSRVANWYAISFEEKIVNGTTKVIVCRFKDDTNNSKRILNEILFWLCEYGADPNFYQNNLITSNDWASIEYFTPLYLAVMIGNSEYIKILLQYKADPNLKSYNGKTPLHEAMSRYSEKSEVLFIDIAKQLLGAEAEPIVETTQNHKLKTKFLTYLADTCSIPVKHDQELGNTSNQLSFDVNLKKRPLMKKPQ